MAYSCRASLECPPLRLYALALIELHLASFLDRRSGGEWKRAPSSVDVEVEVSVEMDSGMERFDLPRMSLDRFGSSV